MQYLEPPYQQNTNPGLICSQEYGWRGAPNYEEVLNIENYVHWVRHNEYGMHDTTKVMAKPSNTHRILILGDSFTRAHHVQEFETNHQVLEDKLNEHNVGMQYEIISSGVSGWGLTQELLYYEQEGYQFEPDTVLLMMYMGNDFSDNLPGRKVTIGGKNCYIPYFMLCDDVLDISAWYYAPPFRPTLGKCYWHEKLFSNIFGTIYQYSQLYNNIEPYLLKRQESMPDPYNINFYEFYRPDDNELELYLWDLQYQLLRKLHAEVTEHGSQLIVVLIPRPDTLGYALADYETRQTLHADKPIWANIEPTLPHERIHQFVTEEGIPVLDLQSQFIAHIRRTDEQLYYQLNWHWDVNGNRVAGRIIHEWLTSNELLSQ
ncbi:hypothetical protein QUF58_03970 [Anaerolineales bacterium HSG24]|nr:hypothetical protein [Anaerolineales bacterium HSG24]